MLIKYIIYVDEVGRQKHFPIKPSKIWNLLILLFVYVDAVRG